jgi:hypothetical protein
MIKALQILSIVGSLSFMAGCAQQAIDLDEALGDAPQVSADANVTGTDKIRFSVGVCNGDGVVVRDGGRFRLGTLIGADVTGISDPSRSANGAVCHNTKVWQTAAHYICNSNPGGNYTGFVQEFDEWVDGSLVRHPAGVVDSGLNYGFVEVLGPCDTPSGKDYALLRIECCAGAPSPAP